MTQSTTNFSWEKPEHLATNWDTELNSCIDEIDASLFVQHNADGTHKGSANVDWGAYEWRADTIRADTSFSKNGTVGYLFVPADAKGDGGFEPYYSTSWLITPKTIGTGTINWNTVFTDTGALGGTGVPSAAKAVQLLVLIDGVNSNAELAQFNLRAKSTTAYPSLHVEKLACDGSYVTISGVVPISAEGTSYYEVSAVGTGQVDVTIYVTGYYI